MVSGVELSSLRPPRQPEMVRARLIAAAVELLNAGAPVSIGSVAEAAEVSKGAVQHHFGTREQLFSALCDACMRQFEAVLIGYSECAVAPALRYAKATLDSVGTDDADIWRALLVASVVERGIAERWRDWIAVDRAGEHEDGSRSLLVRLASDGLWLADLLGSYQISPEERTALMTLMTQIMHTAECEK